MTPGIKGSVQELAEKKKRYLAFVLEWIEQSVAATGKMDSKDPDYAYFVEVMDNISSSVEYASELIDDLNSWANSRTKK